MTVMMHESCNIIYGAPEGQDARILAARAREAMRADRIVLHIALDDTRCANLKDLLSFFAPDVEIADLPAWDCLPYDRVSPHREIVARRIAALAQLQNWQNQQKRTPRILLTTVNAALQRVMPAHTLKQAAITAKTGDRLDLAQLQDILIRSGYARAETVREPGEFAIRGGLIDLFPAGQDNPLRIDLFGDEIETIRTFDALTQRTCDKRKDFALLPVTEFFLDPDSIARFRSGYRESFGVVRENDPLYEAVSEGRRYNGMEHWLPLFHDRMETLFDYVPNALISADQHSPDAAGERTAQIADFYAARRTLEDSRKGKKEKSKDVSLSGTVYHPLPPSRLYLDKEEWQKHAQNMEVFSPFGTAFKHLSSADDKWRSNATQASALTGRPAVAGSPDVQGHPGLFHDGKAKKGRDFGDIRALPEGDVFGALKDYINSLSVPVLIAAYSEGTRARLEGLLNAAGGFAGLKTISRIEDTRSLLPRQCALVLLGIEHGFLADDLCIISEQDILGDRLARKPKKRKKADAFLREISSLSEGDLVVHIDHGVGRFLGLETITAAGKSHDCLKIEYGGGDKLYVPVENIDMLSRFGSDEGQTQLDKMGGAGWQARKAKVKKDLMRMAGQLLEIAAARKLRTAERMILDPGVYNDFAARFPYQETEDQDRAISDVLSDLAGGTPMDRLVCGDVGFGKTEVALRAAYVAAISGTQVALIVPTTLLARQHAKNFMARFQGTGLRVEQLSRLVSTKDAKAVKDGLRDGTVNIVIGTHALLADSIKFNTLGLVIVDEEQRFGVKQKERLKALRKDVHVLTLSATPIPRTLQMSLTGVKELSLIATPPIDRLATRTFVLPFDPVVVREALLREHYRGGQSFYVVPRIKDLEDVRERLAELVPEIRVVVAHGRLSPTDLEDRMTAFYDGRYDVLLATNIIESGIDIPTANTMIVHRADLFGLAQLYQIRGRIGRSKIRAYAYLTWPPAQKLSAQAQKRLEVIETLDTLGSGFQLASHDMDIRGSGNLLGEEQSGHIREVGVELYQQMLEDAVAAAREGAGADTDLADNRWSPSINIGTSVLIPDSYVTDLNIRMSLYRRLSDLTEENDIDSFAAEMIDRFGPLPEEVENLLDIVTIKQLCRTAGVDRVEAGPKGAVIGFYNDTPPNPQKLIAWMGSKGASLKLRPDQKIVAVRIWDKLEQRVRGVRSLMKEMADLK